MMKYLCMECRKIWETKSEARDCCQPAILTLEDHQVMLCSERGKDCEDEMCIFCQGTGWQWKPEELQNG